MPRADDSGNYGFYDYADVLTFMKSIFGDPNQEDTALKELLRLQQKNQDFSLHLAKFQRLALESGIAKEALPKFLENSLSKELKDMLMYCPPPDRFYKTWVSHLKELDCRLRKHSLSASRPTTNAPRPQTTRPTTYAAVAASPTVVATAAAIPRAASPSAKGDPMDLSSARQTQKEHCFQNSLCFRCRQPGHMIANCPLQSQSPNRSSPRPAAMNQAVRDHGQGMATHSAPGRTSPTTSSLTGTPSHTPSSGRSRRSRSRGRSPKKGRSLS